MPVISGWNEQKALEALNIQGYAKRGGKIAVSPIAALAYKFPRVRPFSTVTKATSPTPRTCRLVWCLSHRRQDPYIPLGIAFKDWRIESPQFAAPP